MRSGQRGVVMAVRGREVVALTPDGAFKKMRVQGAVPRVGDEIMLADVKTGSRRGWGMAAAAMVALMLISSLVFQVMALPPAPVAFITLDINPSIELAVDRSERVIKAEPLNEDGRQLLSSLRLKGIRAERAVEEVAAEAVKQGFIRPGEENTVLIAWSPARNGQVQQDDLVDRLKSTAGQVLERSSLGAQVQTVKGSAEMHETAKELGLSVGKYAIWLTTQEAGLEVKLSDLQQSSIAKALKAAGVDPGQIIGKAHEEKDFRKLEEKVKEKINNTAMDKDQEKAIGKDSEQEKEKDKDSEQGNAKGEKTSELKAGNTGKATDGKSDRVREVTENKVKDNKEGARSDEGNNATRPFVEVKKDPEEQSPSNPGQQEEQTQREDQTIETKEETALPGKGQGPGKPEGLGRDKVDNKTKPPGKSAPGFAPLQEPERINDARGKK